MPEFRLRRSCLAVPGSSPKMLAKAAGLPADEVFLDLEGSGAPSQKSDISRENVVRALLDNGWIATTLAVRVNAVSTPWCLADLSFVVTRAGSKLDCVIIPKVEDRSHI